MLAAVCVAGVAPLHFAGCSVQNRVVARALERRYAAGDNALPVYIKIGPNVPLGLTAIGRQPVEVVSMSDLVARYTGKAFAPELTTVSVSERRGLLGIRYSVTVSSNGLSVPGATAIPLGGARIYHFRQWGGLLWADGEDFIAH